MPKTESRPAAAAHAYETRALVLQGGGALGAYQAGVYEGLHEAGIELTDLAGISIGALNAAIIAGNPPERRIERLHDFWNTICQPYVGPVANPLLEHSLFQINDLARQFLGALHAGSALMVGQKGFFHPRFPPAALSAALDPACVGHYDTRPLKDTLESLCDFDRINDAGLRVSIGAVNVRTGNFAYFDNRRTRLRPEHFMASGALPPAFPAIEIDGEYYWDGGLVSNTPLTYVMDQLPAGSRQPVTVFQIDLFRARGRVPETLADAAEREKDIRYSSRTRLVSDEVRARHQLHQRLRRLAALLPRAQRGSAEVQALLAGTLDAPITLVHVIHRRKDSETQTKDYEFSHLSMAEHWQAGGADMGAALQLLGRQGAPGPGEFRVLDPHPDAPMPRRSPAVTSKDKPS